MAQALSTSPPAGRCPRRTRRPLPCAQHSGTRLNRQRQDCSPARGLGEQGREMVRARRGYVVGTHPGTGASDPGHEKESREHGEGRATSRAPTAAGSSRWDRNMLPITAAPGPQPGRARPEAVLPTQPPRSHHGAGRQERAQQRCKGREQPEVWRPGPSRSASQPVCGSGAPSPGCSCFQMGSWLPAHKGCRQSRLLAGKATSAAELGQQMPLSRTASALTTSTGHLQPHAAVKQSLEERPGPWVGSPHPALPCTPMETAGMALPRCWGNGAA